MCSGFEAGLLNLCAFRWLACAFLVFYDLCILVFVADLFLFGVLADVVCLVWFLVFWFVLWFASGFCVIVYLI